MCSSTTSATTPGPSCTPAAPSASEVCRHVVALHPPLTLRAVADLDVEAPHDRAHHGQFFLVLRRHAGHFDRAAAVRTRRRDRRRVGLVDPRRARAAAVAAILRAGPPAGTPAASLRPVLGKRGRLAVAGAARRGQLLLQVVDPMLQAVVLALQAVVLALQAVVLALQAVVLALQAVVLASPGLVVALASRQLPAKPFEVGAQIRNLLLLGRIPLGGCHAKGMPHFPNLYKSNF